MYTTADKVRKLLLGIDATVMDDSDVEAHIVNADAQINSYIGTVYSLPVSATAPLLEKLSGEIASYLIMRTEFTQDSQNISEYLSEYEKAIKTCEEIRDGKMLLVDSSGNELAKDGNLFSSNTKDFHNTFDMDDPEKQNIDTQLLDEIATERDND